MWRVLCTCVLKVSQLSITTYTDSQMALTISLLFQGWIQQIISTRRSGRLCNCMAMITTVHTQRGQMKQQRLELIMAMTSPLVPCTWKGFVLHRDSITFFPLVHAYRTYCFGVQLQQQAHKHQTGFHGGSGRPHPHAQHKNTIIRTHVYSQLICNHIH